MSDEFSVEDVARYWDGHAEAWAEQVRRWADVAREWLNNPAFLEFVGDLHGRRVLDAGCGEGYNTRILARRGARMTGVDLSERMIALARAEQRREPAVRSCLARGLSRAAPGRGARVQHHAPVFSHEGAKWIRNEQGVKIEWTIENYFDPAGWVERWRFTDAPQDAAEFATPRFDRTLSEYVNTLLGAGFALKRIEEPRPSEEYCLAHPSQRGWRDHAALFLYFRAEKPGAPQA
jgi:Methyltransferase domain